jgi:histidinol dehydrogenase
MNITRLSTKQADFDTKLTKLLAFEETADDKLEATVASILADVKKRGDVAVLEYTRKFDRLQLADAAAMELPQIELKAAFDGLLADQREALEQAAQRVTAYHQKQIQSSWSYTEADGTMLGQQITALDRVGLYVPGGKAAYPSSVLMNALPAKVAGVEELIMVVPTPDGIKNQLVLAAAYLSGVDRVFTIGGAQAVAALAYGTATIPKVDKIVGPGNAYVASAKRRVFGVVGIDMIAGPSEILVICDGLTNPDWVAMDLFSQAEHDELAQAILLSPDSAFIDAVAASANKLLEQMPRKDIIKTALENRGALIHVADLDEACRISNRIAPEHLELSVADPQAFGCPSSSMLALSSWGGTPPRHWATIAPGRITFYPLPALRGFPHRWACTTFKSAAALILVSAQGAQTLGAIASTLAFGEGLQAHAQSALFRKT